MNRLAYIPFLFEVENVQGCVGRVWYPGIANCAYSKSLNEYGPLWSVYIQKQQSWEIVLYLYLVPCDFFVLCQWFYGLQFVYQ